MPTVILEVLLILGILLSILAPLEFGFRLGRRTAGTREAPSSAQLSTLQAGVLGLLGLLLGLTFAGASNRFIERQDIIVDQANAIDTAYHRADLLDEPGRDRVRQGIARYASACLELSGALREGRFDSFEERMSSMHDQIWRDVADGIAQRPAVAVVLVPAINEMFDLHSVRVAATRRHLPLLVLTLLFVCSSFAMAGMGFGAGLSGKRLWHMTGALAVLVGCSLWTIIDLDHPRKGLIQTDDRPLMDLRFRAPLAQPSQ